MWTDKQKEAIAKRNSNILVAASAGSGKTAVLVERVISRVLEDKIDINKLLIVTFTNASASELKERLLHRIYEALDNNTSDAFLKRQIKNLNISNIETIHSFCLKLIRSNFNILELDPNVQICDESRSRVLKIKAINQVLEHLYKNANNDEAEKIKLYKILEIFSSKDDNLVEYILKIYSYINSFSYPFDFLKQSIEKYNMENQNIDLIETDFGKLIFDDVLNSISMLIEKEELIANELREKYDFEKQIDVLNEDISYMRSILNESNNWDRLYNMLKGFSFLRMPPYKGENIALKDEMTEFRNKILKKEIEELKQRVYEESVNILKDNKLAYEYVKNIYDILLMFDKKYKLLKRESELIDFNDIEHLALDLLVKKADDGSLEITEIAKAKKEEFEEVYTDEYQDTSLVQESILCALSKNNNRFMVGDVKQSIYKFRQAMPEIFNNKYKEYELNDNNSKSSEVKILLNKNFRSRRNVIESINYIFEKIMSYEIGGSNYSDIEKLEFGATLYKENSINDYKTQINIIDLKDDEINKEKLTTIDEYILELKSFEIEALMISNKIKRLVKEFKVYDIKKQEFRNCKYKDIVILLRGIKDKGKILEDTLKKEGIPSFCDANTSLFESDEIKLVLSILRVIDNPFQDIYMVSVMYSIIGKFSLDELLIIKNMGNGENIYNSLYIAKDILDKKKKSQILNENDKTLLNKIDKFIDFLKEYITYSKIYTVSEILLKLYNQTSLYDSYLLEEDMSKLKLANLDYLVDIASNFENSFDDTSIFAYITYVDNLKDKADSSSSTAKILGENEDVVRIMTIHKSKGLEFPVVILSDTTRKYNIKDMSSSIVMDNNLGIGINVVNEELNITYPSVIKQAIKNKIIKDTKSEELRMLYVAMTRAKEKLIIFATLKDYDRFLKNQNAIISSDKIDYKIIEKNNTYFSNIMIALNNKEKIKELFDINVIKIGDIKLNIENNKKQDDRNMSILDKIDFLKNGIKQDIKSENEKDIISIDMKKIIQNIEFKYQYLEDTKQKNRISVSQLKEENSKLESEKFENDISKDKILEFSLPSCLELKKDTQTGASKGTLIHSILQSLDYKNINSKEDLEKYVTLYKITKYDINRIYSFISSDIGNQLRKSNEIHKEEEFILKDETISKSQIQGIIDLYYINENGNIVLIDFKTDNLEDESEYIKRYKIQLDIYRKALEKLTGKVVENVYIYSFKLGRGIEIKG